MQEDTNHSLVVQTGGGLVRSEGGGRVLAEMVKEALALSRASGALIPKFKIGDYEWCEPDYQQILTWAAAMEMEPLEVIERLLEKGGAGEEFEIETEFKNGRIINLRWDLAVLPLDPFDMMNSLIVEELCLRSNRQVSVYRELSLSLPSLRRLDCMDNRLSKLGLSHIPLLTQLWCSGDNPLAELDLSHLPELTELACDNIRLTELDLSHVPLLTLLCCDENQLTKLDLSQVAKLKHLWCNKNQLNELDLSRVPELKHLWCNKNQLNELDLSRVPELKDLWCYENQISELDLSQVPMLTKLGCAENEIAELDLSRVPKLTELFCNDNQIAELDIRPLIHLKTLEYDYDKTRLIQRPDQNF